MVSTKPDPTSTTSVTPTNGAPAQESDTALSLSDTSSTMTKPQLPTPHKHQIHVLIIGAGLGGLAAAIKIALVGHRVTILEAAPKLAEVGAGIQISPNSSRLLKRWGVGEKLEKDCVNPKGFILRGYHDGKILSEVNLVPHGVKKYGYPYWHAHRADFHKAMLERALELGVEVHINSFVTNLDFNDPPKVTVQGGKVYTADLVVGCDGLRSVCRENLVGHADPPHETGDIAYRILVTADQMRPYPELHELLDDPAINVWMGPRGHAVCYLLKGGNLYNIVLIAPDDLPPNVNTAKGEVEEMRATFGDWDPKLKRLLSLVDTCLKWKLQNSDPSALATWVHPHGTFCLLGDAAHATLPYLAQGAAISVEDGGVLGGLLGKIRSKKDISRVLALYEQLRRPRCSAVVLGSTKQQDIFHMENGPAQEERDRIMLTQNPPKPGHPNQWADPVMQEFLYGYDADDEVEKAWDSLMKQQPRL